MMKEDQKKYVRELEDALVLESIGMTHAETMSLMAHDLGHRALHALDAVETLAVQIRKAYRNGLLDNRLQNEVQLAINACSSLAMHVSDINKSARPRYREQTHINITETIKDVSLKFRETLIRNNMSASITDNNQPLSIYGSKQILEQIISQLIMNSIDAQRGRKNARKNNITININKQGSLCSIQYMDEGVAATG